MAINKKNNRHTTPPQTHIALIMPLSKGIGLCHRSGTWNNKGRQRTTPCDKQYSNRKEIHSKSKDFLSLVLSIYPPLKNPVINPLQLSLVSQQSSSSSQNTPWDTRCVNIKNSNSKRNEFSSTVIPVYPPLND